jgi:SAM-dependent methyltransferase
MDLEAQFGGIDIYLFDQILRRRIVAGDRIVDAGCGFGRNLVYLLREGYEVFGADADRDAIGEVRALAARLAPGLPEENFRAEPIERMTFPERFASVVISSAVLHFARDDAQFEAMLEGSWRLLGSGGMFFCRLASTIGIESQVRRLDTGGKRRHRLPDGTDRYLVDEAMLMALTGRLGGKLLDPLKTTVVQGQRSMTTWVVRKD